MRAWPFLAALVLGVAAGPAAAGQPYAVPGSEVRDMVARSGAAYRVYVARPQAPPPPQGYPVLYVLDGEDSFAIAAETARRLSRFPERSSVEPGLVVAIGYPAASRRAIDYTPAAASSPGAPAGGAEAFLDFIVEELRPAIALDHPTDAARQTLMGHSYGGLFVLNALFTRPEAFQTYVAVSPSIWFADHRILALEAPFAERFAKAGLKRRLAIAVGELEQSEPGPATGLMVDDARGLAGRLQALAPAGLSVDWRLLSGDSHGTTPLAGTAIGVAAAFGRAP